MSREKKRCRVVCPQCSVLVALDKIGDTRYSGSHCGWKFEFVKPEFEYQSMKEVK